jgi:hypothetical protein
MHRTDRELRGLAIFHHAPNGARLELGREQPARRLRKPEIGQHRHSNLFGVVGPEGTTGLMHDTSETTLEAPRAGRAPERKRDARVSIISLQW